MQHYTDIAVYDKDGRLQLLVEAKGKRDASKNWAAKFRRNMYVHGQLPRVPYFLLALPDRFYLWKDTENPYEIVDPQYSIDPASSLTPYFELASGPPLSATGSELELALSSWLDKLTSAYGEAVPASDEQWLRRSGLLEAVRGGRVEVQALV